jgi:sec-independent protein translocase protein TatA
MFGGIGAQELLLILFVILLLFGAKKLPEVARGLGKGIAEFKKAMRETEEEIKKAAEEPKRADNKSQDASPKKEIP